MPADAPTTTRLDDLVRTPERGCHIGLPGNTRCLCGIPWAETNQLDDAHAGLPMHRAPDRCPGCGNTICPTCHAEARRLSG
jgi:hypothetical protein